MREIPLTQGYVAIVDDEDYERSSHLKWHARVVRRKKDGSVLQVYAYNGKVDTSLHRFVMGITDRSCWVDHRDHHGLNCQKANLRLTTATQNQGNRRQRHDSTSSFKGITWIKDHKSWRAAIKMNGKNKFLGHFKDPTEAAKAYDAAALDYFGPFALINFPQPKAAK